VPPAPVAVARAGGGGEFVSAEEVAHDGLAAAPEFTGMTKPDFTARAAFDWCFA
jgi:hypothetical protein